MLLSVSQVSTFLRLEYILFAFRIHFSVQDNVEAREYVDAMCVKHGRWLLDSGTLGTKGNTQVGKLFMCFLLLCLFQALRSFIYTDSFK